MGRRCRSVKQRRTEQRSGKLSLRPSAAQYLLFSAWLLQQCQVVQILLPPWSQYLWACSCPSSPCRAYSQVFVMLERVGCTSAHKISVLTCQAKGLSHHMKGAALAK